MKKGLGFLFFIFVFCVNLVAQVPFFTEEQARQELERRGLDENEFNTRLQEKGVDLYSLNPEELSPFEIERIQQVVQETLAEMESEKDFDIETTVEEEVTDELEEEVDEQLEKEVKEGLAEEAAEEKVEEIVEKTISEIYGHQLFRDQQIEPLLDPSNTAPPDSYILGVGDQIIVSIWGTSVLQNGKYEIDSEGYIRPAQMRPIFLKGIAYKKAKEIIRSGFRQRYRFLPEQFDVTLDFSRTINVNIIGEVIDPDTYTLPALNTAINALAASGGPNNIGSVRNIQIVRSGEEPKFLDLYEFLQNPAKQDDYFLQNNDHVYVPVAEKIVEIQGAVKRPFKYELLKEENLIELIDFAGGLVDSAYQSNIQVERFQNDERQILDVNLKRLYDNNGNFPLLKGDKISIRTIPKPYENFVTIEGEVLIPGKFQLTQKMRINDLVEKAVLRREAKTDRVFLKRFEADSTVQYFPLNLDSIINFPAIQTNMQLQPRDVLMIGSKSIEADKGTVTIRGAVRAPIEMPFDLGQDLKLEEAITLAGGLHPEAYPIGYLKRKNPNNKEQLEWRRFNVIEAVSNPTSEDNFTLMPYDTIEILANPTFTDQYQVRVAGAVRNSGDFQYDETLTLKDVLTLAGGLKLEAASNQIEIFRLVMRENQPTQTNVATVEVDEDFNVPIGGEFPLAPFDLIVVRSVPDFEMFQTININGEVLYPGTYALLDKNERLLSVIERAGGLTEEAFPPGATLYRQLDSIGYVVMELDEVLKDKDSRYNFILKEGDIVAIPKKEDLVTIQGEIRARELYPDKYLSNGRINTAYHSGKRASFYINRYAAGVGENGKRGLVTVEHPNGRIVKTTDLLAFKIYPKVQKGSIINVGKKPPKDLDREQRELEREPVDWGRVLADSIGQAGSIISLILLIQRL